MDFSVQEKRIRNLFEEYLASVTDDWNFPQPLTDAMRYALYTGGKRFRPVLLLSACEAFCGSIPTEALMIAVAIECLHTYSLVHDDLPCMDDDDFRRGQPTVHKKFGEDIAVLTGDALLNMAFEQIFSAASNSNRAVIAGKCFASRTGANGLIGGQIADLAFAESSDKAALDYVFEHKTCDLIVAAVECGAIMGGASDDDLSHARSFAYNFGYAFQVADDILDGEQSDGCSILKIMSKQDAKDLLAKYTQAALAELEQISVNTDFLANFTKLAQLRTK